MVAVMVVHGGRGGRGSDGRCGRGGRGGRGRSGGFFGRRPLGAVYADKPHTSCKSRAGTRCKLTTFLRSTLPPTSHNSPFRILVLHLRRILPTPPLPVPFAPIREPPCSSTLMPVTISYDLHAIADARHSLGSAC